MTPTRAALLLVAAFALVGPFVVTDYGITWDELVQREYGQLTLDYWLSGGADTRFVDYRDLRFHGPLFEVLPEAINRATGDRWPYEVRHACTFLAALAALLGLVAVARQLGLTTGVPLAVLALLAMPRFIGHAFNNTKDIPFLACWIWTIWALLRATGTRRLRDAALAGVFVGCALGIRIAATMLVLICALALAASSVRDTHRPLTAFGRLAVFGLVGWTVMVLGWPFAHLAPIKHPLLTVLDVVHLKTVIPVLFDGAVVQSDALPRYYPGAFLLIGTPLPTLLLALLGAALALHARTLPWAVVLAWLLLPQLVFAAMGNNVYDGLRHFLFLTPAVALLAGLGAERLLALHDRRWTTLALALALAWGLIPIVQLHPYQHTYFNQTVGGLPGADGRFETEYYASSYRETALWLRDEATRRGATPERPLRVLAGANEYIEICLTYYLRDAPVEVTSLLELDGSPPPPHDLYVSLRRFGWERAFPHYRTIHTIGRAGVPFVLIRQP